MATNPFAFKSQRGNTGMGVGQGNFPAIKSGLENTFTRLNQMRQAEPRPAPAAPAPRTVAPVAVASSTMGGGGQTGNVQTGNVQTGNTQTATNTPLPMNPDQQARIAAAQASINTQNGSMQGGNMAQAPDTAVEGQARARLQAAQPSMGAGPGNPTSAANNQPGQSTGLISGQMARRA